MPSRPQAIASREDTRVPVEGILPEGTEVKTTVVLGAAVAAAVVLVVEVLVVVVGAAADALA
jgi:hypothetical protein